MMTQLNVLYQSDNNYAEITGVSLTSLLMNNQDIDELTVYIIADRVSQENLAKFQQVASEYQREVHIIDAATYVSRLRDEYKVFPFKGSYATYFKLLAVADIQTNNDVILQLDGDTIIDKSLAGICDIDPSDALIYATYDCTMNSYKPMIGIPETDHYYNGGVLLINQRRWRDEDCTGQIVEHFLQRRSGYQTVDQDVLNVLFRNEFKYLDITYNFNPGFYIFGIDDSLKMYHLAPAYYDTKEHIAEVMAAGPTIYHMMGAMTGRPWEQNSIHPQNDLFDHYVAASPWSDFVKKTVKRKSVFRVQRWLYQHAPRRLYLLLHEGMQYFYLSHMNRRALAESGRAN